jgi:hypoxanthine phosphoribosyltransferase
MSFTRALPEHLEVLYPRDVIQARLRELAPVLDTWARASLRETDAPLMALCVLRGGVFFFSDLVQGMLQSVEPAFCRAASYARAANASQSDQVQFTMGDIEVRGRDVVIIDNICDSGRTFQVAMESVLRHGARSARTVALIYRQRADSLFRPTLNAFEYDQEDWLAGYGMRDKGALMNYPEVYRVKRLT